MQFSEQELIQRLQTSRQLKPKPGTAADNWQHAAVLVNFVKVEQQWCLLFIRRAEAVGDAHSGQVGFPGGRVEAGEDAVAAALREAQEEIGLAHSEVKVICQLNDFYSISNYRVTPVLALSVWPYDYVLQLTEVSRVFVMPLEWLATPANYRQQEMTRSSEVFNVIHYAEYDGELLWGLTADIVRSILSLLEQAPKIR